MLMVVVVVVAAAAAAAGGGGGGAGGGGGGGGGSGSDSDGGIPFTRATLNAGVRFSGRFALLLQLSTRAGLTGCYV